MDLSEGYRRARRSGSAICALGLAWAAAQFELRSVTLGPLGTVDFSNASIPLLLACGVAYAYARCVLEFAMQPDEVRRWSLAQTDFRLTQFLVRATVLMLGASGLYRAPETIAWVLLAVLGFLLLIFLIAAVGTFTIMPILLFIRGRQGRHFVAARVPETMAWSRIISFSVTILAVLAVGAAAAWHEPTREAWGVRAPPIGIGAAAAAALAVVLSFFTAPSFEAFLFAYQDPYVEITSPEGRTYLVPRDEAESFAPPDEPPESAA